MKIVICLFVLCCGALFTHDVLAHNTTGWLEESKGILIVAAYDDEEPISYGKVDIYAPDSKNTFQSGHTDRNGFFMFIPDQAGTWRVTVDDGLGHKLVLAEEVTVGNRILPVERVKAKTSKAVGLISGVGIILGIGGILYGIQQRKKIHTQDNVA